MRKLFLLLLFGVSVLAAMAQGQRRTVSGRVFSSTGEELVNAVIMFKDLRDSTKIYHSVCDAGGCYNQELPYGRYSCTVSFLGECYIPDNNVVSIYEQNTVIPDIRISLKEEALDEVTVVAKRPFVSYSGSKARYNLSANPASVGGTLSDGIKLIPGIQVKESGGLSVFGFYNLKVAVNGRILRLSNEEIQAYVASLQTYYNRPSFRDLMPYASHSEFLYRLGNSGLKNSKRYNISLSYSYMRAATIELSFSNEKDPVIEYLTPYKGGYALTKTNLDNSRYMRIVTGAPIPVIYKEDGLQWVVSTYVAYHIQRDRGAVNSLDYNHTFQACYVQHKQSLNLPSQWYFDAQITYYSPLSVGVYKTEKQWWTDFTVSRRVRNWRFSVSGYDIFNTNVAKGRIEGMKDHVSFVQNWHSPKITFGISCTFGNKDLKTYNRKSVNSESRLNRSANEGINLQSH